MTSNNPHQLTEGKKEKKKEKHYPNELFGILTRTLENEVKT